MAALSTLAQVLFLGLLSPYSLTYCYRWWGQPISPQEMPLNAAVSSPESSPDYFHSLLDGVKIGATF